MELLACPQMSPVRTLWHKAGTWQTAVGLIRDCPLQAFNDAYNLVEVTEGGAEKTAPYLFRNHTGQMVTLKLDETFKVGDEGGKGMFEFLYVSLVELDESTQQNSILEQSLSLFFYRTI